MKERLQKILSQAGVCSRRAAEELVCEGRVKINGVKACIGASADPDADEITVDGKKVISNIKERTYIMLNKPRGYVTTLSDESGRKTVKDLLSGIDKRIYPVGRLDMYSEGLLLLTDDGELAYKLTHPRHEVYKEYLVKITSESPAPSAPPDIVLSKPMTIDGIKLLPAKCRVVEKLSEEKYILLIAIREGKNRQIRRMCKFAGWRVNSLKRVAIGDLKLSDLETGKYRHLTEEEIKYLKNL